MRIFRLQDVITATGLSRSTLYKYISEGTFPKPVSLGDRCVGWVDSEVHDWILVRIPRHPATQSTLIRPGIPRTSGHLFHDHSDRQSERSDAGMALLFRGARRRQFIRPFTHRFALEVDPVSVVHQAVEDGVGQGRIADQFVPVVHRHLAGDQGRALAVAIIQ